MATSLDKVWGIFPPASGANLKNKVQAGRAQTRAQGSAGAMHRTRIGGGRRLKHSMFSRSGSPPTSANLMHGNLILSICRINHYLV